MAIDATVALVTEAEAFEVVGSGAASSEYVTMLANAVSADFTKRIGGPLLEATVDEYYDGTGTPDLCLKRYPVSTVTGLYVGAGETVSLTEGPTADFVVDKEAGMVRLVGGKFPYGVQNIKVSYTGGWAVADVPHDIKYAVKKAIAFLLAERSRIGVQAITTPEQVTQYIDAAYPKGIAEVVRNYRRMIVR